MKKHLILAMLVLLLGGFLLREWYAYLQPNDRITVTGHLSPPPTVIFDPSKTLLAFYTGLFAPLPIPAQVKTDEETQAWFKTWSQSDEGRAYLAKFPYYEPELMPDGTFRAAGVRPHLEPCREAARKHDKVVPFRYAPLPWLPSSPSPTIPSLPTASACCGTRRRGRPSSPGRWNISRFSSRRRQRSFSD